MVLHGFSDTQVAVAHPAQAKFEPEKKEEEKEKEEDEKEEKKKEKNE